jgi:hypothetical protein
MYKLIAGVISITILAPIALLSGGGGAAENAFEVLAVNIFDLPAKTNYQDIAVDHPDSLVTIPEKKVNTVNTRLQSFVEEVYTGQPNVLTGVFVDGVFAMDIVQQPSNQPGFISSEEEKITEFRLAKDYGTTGLMAHNYLAGQAFFQLEAGQAIYLVYGDGEIEAFTIAEVKKYKALSPNSPYSEFVDLEKSNVQVSAEDLFYHIYGQEGALIMQTCIENEGISTWGRLFIIALPGAVPAELGMQPL